VFKLKGHLTMKETWDFVREPRILDIAEDLIGPNILAFASRFWVKPGSDGSFVSWHQDSAYFGCDPHDMVTCWVALTPANRGNGCMRSMPGSHKIGYEHDESHENAPGDAPGEKKNLLGRGQTIRGLDESKAVHMELEQGQFSIHNERTAHASGPNNTPDVRIGYSFFLIPTHVKSTLERRPATLVRGVDEYGYWDTDPVPTEESMGELIDQMLKNNAQYTNPKFRQDA
jgi:non-heme Fe2+,alpha-ketoglutarate-dependent halogenase